MIFKEILAGSLRLQAERLQNMSRANPEPDGWQARAQANEARRLLEWSGTELAAAESSRDFDTEKLSREEVAWAIRFAEEKTEEFINLFVELHEQKHGPIGDLTVALEQEPGDFKETPEQETAMQHWSKYQEALIQLKSMMRCFQGPSTS